MKKKQNELPALQLFKKIRGVYRRHYANLKSIREISQA